MMHYILMNMEQEVSNTKVLLFFDNNLFLYYDLIGDENVS